MDDPHTARELFEEVNQLALGTELEQLTMDDIIEEIKAYRLEKKSNNNTASFNARSFGLSNK